MKEQEIWELVALCFVGSVIISIAIGFFALFVIERYNIIPLESRMDRIETNNPLEGWTEECYENKTVESWTIENTEDCIRKYAETDTPHCNASIEVDTLVVRCDDGYDVDEINYKILCYSEKYRLISYNATVCTKKILVKEVLV